VASRENGDQDLIDDVFHANDGLLKFNINFLPGFSKPLYRGDIVLASGRIVIAIHLPSPFIPYLSRGLTRCETQDSGAEDSGSLQLHRRPVPASLQAGIGFSGASGIVFFLASATNHAVPVGTSLKPAA
jgi:hypothetical protein